MLLFLVVVAVLGAVCVWGGGVVNCVRQLPWSQKDKDKKIDIIGDL